jgi:hypothetical protein
MKWSDRVKWYDIPEHMRGGIIRYVERGIPPGHFLQAVFANDLMEACKRGDGENVRLIPAYAVLLSNQCPGGCWGSLTNVRAWTARGGIMGNDENEALPVHEWSRWSDQIRKTGSAE